MEAESRSESAAADRATAGSMASRLAGGRAPSGRVADTSAGDEPERTTVVRRPAASDDGGPRRISGGGTTRRASNRSAPTMRKYTRRTRGPACGASADAGAEDDAGAPEEAAGDSDPRESADAEKRTAAVTGSPKKADPESHRQSTSRTLPPFPLSIFFFELNW